MATTLLNCEIILSKQLGDYWSSSTTGAGSSTTMVDTALKAKTNDWIDGDREMYVFLIEEPAGNAAIYDERKISSLDISSGTLTTLAFLAAPGTGIDYEVHRLFTPSEKRRALVQAAKAIYPHLFIEIRDESFVSGNWLKDGSFEIWTSSSTLTHWTATSTIAQTSTAGYLRHGAYSVKISGSAGTIVQEWKVGTSENEGLQNLRGHSITFTIQAWSDNSTDLRLSINDGTTQTYSGYHAGDSAWTQDEPRNDNLYVTQYIDPNATQVTLTIHYGASGTASYVDDARVIASVIDSPGIYIGNLGLVQNKPHQVLMEPLNYSTREPWALIHNIRYDQTNGYMYLPSGISQDYRLRILGNKYLDFYDSSDVVGTDWPDTIALNTPQIEILVAEAAVYLCLQRMTPNYTSGESDRWEKALAYWQRELMRRISRYGMFSPGVTVSWR